VVSAAPHRSVRAESRRRFLKILLRNLGYIHKSGVQARDFLSVDANYPHVVAWADRILARPAVQRGLTVCSFNGKAKPWLEKTADAEGNK
jgi:hypothetical protein